MITRPVLFGCRRSVPAIFRLLAAAIPSIVPFGFAAAQQPPSFTDQRGAARLSHPSDLAFRRWKYFYEPRAYPFGQIPPGAYQSALQDYNRKWGAAERLSLPGMAPASAAITGTIWKPIGPAPISTSPSTSGRVNSIAIHPFDPNIIYIGGAEGGVWKTVDGGQSWVPLTDRQCSLAMGAIAIDPINPNIVYAGTGDENFEHDAYSGCGVLRSTDSGATWTQLGASTFVSPTTGSGATISRIVVDPTTAGSATTTKIYVASSIGVYRSTDSGVTWSHVLLGGLIQCVVVTATDLVVKPGNPATVYGVLSHTERTECNGVYKSTNGGDSWSQLGGGLPTANIGRINLAISRSAPTTLYASIQNMSTSGLLGIWKTTDAGATWTQLAATGADCDDQCWFDMYLAVDPNMANVIYFGGFSIYKSTDGGASFANIGGPIHVDQHAFAFDPTNHDVIYTGNDGGIFRSADTGSTWTSLNTNLALTQFYPGVSLHPTKPSIAMAGAQDNDVDLYTGAMAWTPMPIPLEGDGGFTAIDFVTPTTGYAEVAWIIPGQGPFRTENFLSAAPDWRLKAGNVQQHTNINANDPALFIPPLVMSPTNSQTLYFGTTHLYRTTDRGENWTDILINGTGAISAVAQAKSNPSVIYVGTSDGNVQITQTGGPPWASVTTGLPTRAVTYLAISPSNAATAFVVVSGFGTGHVFKTTNSGATWSGVSGNLPNIPVNTILLDPGAPTTNIYIGTDLGVFRTTDGGSTWAPFNNGLPKVAILDLAFNRKTKVLMAATHGRSAWKIAAPNRPVISVAPPTRDYGSVVHGATADASFTITNIAQGTLMGNASLSGSGAFSIASGGTFNLGAGASQAVTVRFAPTTLGRFDTDLNFSSNDGVAEAVLSGAGR